MKSVMHNVIVAKVAVLTIFLCALVAVDALAAPETKLDESCQACALEDREDQLDTQIDGVLGQDGEVTNAFGWKKGKDGVKTCKKRHGRKKHGRKCRRCRKLKVKLRATHYDIKWGESTKLIWKCRRADSCELSSDSGPVASGCRGRLKVSPKKTTRYTLMGRCAKRVAHTSVTVTVINPSPTITIEQPADGSSHTLGMDDTLPVRIHFKDDTGIDTAGFSAELDDEDITSLLTVTESGATGTLPKGLAAGSHTLTVAVNNETGHSATATSRFEIGFHPPTVTLNADPQTVKFGQTTVLTWTAANAETLSIEPMVGEVEPGESKEIAIFEKTTYTITAAGPGGKATASVIVDVTDVPPPGIYYQYDALGRIKHIVRIPGTGKQ